MKAFHLKCQILTIVIVLFMNLIGYTQNEDDVFNFLSRAELNANQLKKFDRIQQKAYAISVKAFELKDWNFVYNTGLIKINLNTNEVFEAELVHKRSLSQNEYSWVGKPKSGIETGEYVIFEKTSRGLTGAIWYKNVLYSIIPLDKDVSVIYQVDQGQFPPEHPNDGLEKTEQQPVLNLNVEETLRSYSLNQYEVTGSIITYDLMVVYTPAAKDSAGDIIGLINTAWEQTNQIYSNSQAMTRANLVETFEVNYTEVDISTDLDRLIDPSDGYMDEVHDYRDQCGADIVVLIVGRGNACGKAGAIKAEDWNAFAVVKWDCATQRYTFTHEIAHLFGSEHELGYDEYKNNPWPYNHAFTHFGPTFQTVVAVKGDGGFDKIPYLSTPSVPGYYNGNYYTIGSADWEDNARVHTERAAAVAGFRTPPLSVTITGPTYLNDGETGEFIANPSGGTGDYINYKWWYRNDEGGIGPESKDGGITPDAPPSGEWIYLFQWEGYQTITFGPSFDFSLKCEVTDSDQNTATDIHSVVVGSGSFSKEMFNTNRDITTSPPKEFCLERNYPIPLIPPPPLDLPCRRNPG